MKFAICSEIFNDWQDIHRAIRYTKQIGYDGFEIAPFTLAPDVTMISKDQRKTILDAAGEVGLDIVGLHWLLAGTEGYHLTHPEKTVRDKTAQYVIDLTQFCSDIGGRIMVFGSPKQRDVMPGVTYDHAFDNAIEVFQKALPVCADLGVTICMEPLTHLETNFCTSADEAVRLIEAINHPNFRLILDVKAMAFETELHRTLIKKHAKHLAHFHANDENLRGPGAGDVDFAPIFQALHDIDYQGYMSVEVFNFEEGPEAIAKNSLAYLRKF